MDDKKNVGRPFAKNPKAQKLTVRVDNSNMKILDDYCQRENVSRADGVRNGIRCLQDKRCKEVVPIAKRKPLPV